MSDGTPGSGFAELLRELKDRSGLSYGTLAKRLHMSTSTLHRYCNGDAVPTDYAPVERLARLCKAGPAELVELHRRWVLADADRGRKQEAADRREAREEREAREAREAREERATREEREARVAGPMPVADAAPENGAPATVGAEHAVQDGPLAEPASAAGPGAGNGVAVGAGGGGRSRWVPRPVLLAGTVAVALLGAAVFAVGLPSGGSGDDKHAGPAGAATPLTRGPRTPTPSPSGTPSGATPSRSVSASASVTATDRAAEAGTAPSSAVGGTGTGTSAAPPLTVNTQPYSWESPCSQRYLIDRSPADVAPPPVESDAAAWVAAHQAVSSGEQYVTLTVQGTGTESVVLESLTVRTVDRGAPLAWNDYAMGYPGVGCGAGVPTRSFTVALDAMRPAVVPEAGHRDFPFKVSESDPEVFYVRADASAYSVGWYLELAWSSGSRHGTLRIGDKGRPFRTSGNNGRPAYEFPLGGEAWRSGSPASAG